MQEVNFSAGELLGSDGTAGGEYIYLIAQGQVDVLRSTSSCAGSEEADADADDDIVDDDHCQYPHTCLHNFLLQTVMYTTVMYTTVMTTSNKGSAFACRCSASQHVRVSDLS